MTQTAHTPGPWFVAGVRAKISGLEALNVSRYEEDKKKDDVIASVWFNAKTGLGWNDARLIAAAPTMFTVIDYLLEVVTAPDKACQCHLSPPCHDCVEHGATRELLEMAKAVHAKATGAA